MAGKGDSAQGGSSHWTPGDWLGKNQFPPHPAGVSRQGEACLVSRLSPAPGSGAVPRQQMVFEPM